MKQTQLLFKAFDRESKKDFGGTGRTGAKGNPRERRPISVKRPMHLVMRSSIAVGEKSFLRTRYAKRIEEFIRRSALENGVKIYRYANSGNHLHLLVMPRSRDAFNAFSRVVTGLIARVILGAEKGQGKGVKFWDARPFSRILEWGRKFKIVSDYLLKTTLESLGFIPFVRRRNGKIVPKRLP